MVREEEEEERKGGEDGEEEEGEERRRRKGGGVQNALHAAGSDGGARVSDGLVERVLDWTAWQKRQAPLRKRATSRKEKRRLCDDDGEAEEANVGGLAAALHGLLRAWGLLLLDNDHMLVMSGLVRCAAWWWEKELGVSE